MVSLALVALLAIGATPAEDAKRAYEKALKYSNAGEYEVALPYFQKAYELSKKRPSTIVALAQCERELKMYEQAILHFKEYLSIRPSPKDASQIEETVALLEDLRDEELARLEREKTEAKPPAPPPPPPPIEVAVAPPPPPPPAIVAETAPEPEPASVFESPTFWIITGSVVVAIAVGVTLGVTLAPDAELYPGTSGVLLEK